MITRSRARKSLAEFHQQIPVQSQSAPFVKPQQIPETIPKEKPTSSESEEQQSAEGDAIIAKKMNIISLDSSSEEDDASYTETGVIDLPESSRSVIDLSSSDDTDDDQSDMPEEDDEEEIDYSEGEKRDQTDPAPARLLLAEEVAKIIRGGDLKKLRLDDCKAYLRSYGLRITGTKPVLIDRIKQHIELKEAGFMSYHRSTFTIGCTGDVCKGDVVMFDQKVYKKSSLTAKSATQSGSRTIAGRVVKESYGAQRQQHTFTVEVLWSTGCCPLPPMKPLLVKGRNLYKRKTFRQEWADEGERQRTLDEKHERGGAARQIRAVKQGRFKGRQGNEGLQGLSRKQLANPYTNTLASKALSNCLSGNVFQSAVSSHQVATVRTPPDRVRHHASTGANAVPLGRIRQFVLPSENVVVEEATGCATRSIIKHRQWFKPAPLQLRLDRDANKQQAFEVQNVSTSAQLQGDNSGFQSVPVSSHQVATVQTRSDRVRPHSTTGANAVPLGRIRQFVIPSENVVVEGAAGCATRSINKHGQSFKPAPLQLRLDRDSNKQLPSEVQNVSTSAQLQGDSSGSQSVLGEPAPKFNYFQNGFPCATELCVYRGSGSCSSGLCYYCCKRKGGNCRNPRHRPQLKDSLSTNFVHSRAFF